MIKKEELVELILRIRKSWWGALAIFLKLIVDSKYLFYMNCDIVFNLFEKDSISRLKDDARFKLMKS